jgi:hypothetical protein
MMLSCVWDETLCTPIHYSAINSFKSSNLPEFDGVLEYSANQLPVFVLQLVFAIFVTL